MTNPNSVLFISRTTADKYITEYGYSYNSGMFTMDYKDMVEVYGKENVKFGCWNGKRWIVVTQKLWGEVQ